MKKRNANAEKEKMIVLRTPTDISERDVLEELVEKHRSPFTATAHFTPTNYEYPWPLFVFLLFSFFFALYSLSFSASIFVYWNVYLLTRMFITTEC